MLKKDKQHQSIFKEPLAFMQKTPTYLSDAKKTLIISKYNETHQQDEVVRTVPSKPLLREILEKGIQDGAPTDENTFEGMR